eukprot:351122-Chlamydomonas_euryale.AAC.5
MSPSPLPNTLTHIPAPFMPARQLLRTHPPNKFPHPPSPPPSATSAPSAAEWIETNLPTFGKVTGESFQGGSNWSSAYIYSTDSGKKLFVKTALGAKDDAMFRGEALGLQAMRGEALLVKREVWVGQERAGRGSDALGLQSTRGEAPLFMREVRVRQEWAGTGARGHGARGPGGEALGQPTRAR